jgi:hypothetical protein
MTQEEFKAALVAALPPGYELLQFFPARVGVLKTPDGKIKHFSTTYDDTEITPEQLAKQLELSYTPDK